jgi:bacterioferritin-associated ferredoxin
VLVCHCRKVNDRAVRASVEAGARTVPDVAARCGAGTRCGGCWPAIDQLLASVRDSSDRQCCDHVQSVA